jgi:hypothetical protein
LTLKNSRGKHSKYNPKLFTEQGIYTHTISKQLKLDFEKYNHQYKNITIKSFKDSYDRFLIIDKKEVYLIGASLKDLGKKWFGFSRLDISSIDSMIKRLDY